MITTGLVASRIYTSTSQKAMIPPLQLQRMQNELLEALDSVLQIAHRQGLVVPVGDEDGARPVEIPGVVAVKIWDVGSVVGDNGVEA